MFVEKTDKTLCVIDLDTSNKSQCELRIEKHRYVEYRPIRDIHFGIAHPPHPPNPILSESRLSMLSVLEHAETCPVVFEMIDQIADFLAEDDAVASSETEKSTLKSLRIRKVMYRSRKSRTVFFLGTFCTSPSFNRLILSRKSSILIV